MNMKQRMLSGSAGVLVLVVAASALASTAPFAATAISQGGSSRAVSADSESHENETLIADGVKVTSRIAVARVLLDPDTNIRVVPLVAELELSYNGQTFNRSMAFEIRPADQAVSVVWTLAPVGPAVVDESLTETIPNRMYEFRIAPRTGAFWKDVRSMRDAVLTIIEIP